MIYNDPDTCTEQFASVPHPTCRLHPRFEAAKCLAQRDISDHYSEEYQQSIHFHFQVIITLCILFTIVVAAAAASVILCWLSRQHPSQAGDTLIPPRARAPHKATVVSASIGNHTQPLDPVPAGTNGASDSKRGKGTLVREIISELPSNAAQTQAQTAFVRADTDLALATHGLQSEGINEETTGDIERPQGTTHNAPCSRRGPSSPVRQSSLPVVNETVLGFFQAGFYDPIASLVGRFADTVRDRIGRRPLLHSLHGHNPTFSVFTITGEDAERDLEALKCVLNSGHVRFVDLSQDIDLEAEIERLYDDCRKVPGTHLFIYLSGHGNLHNELIIPESKTISETHLFKILPKPTIPITILFDICRQDQRPSETPPSGISLIWTCSVGEIAGACRVPSCNAPSSCFLIALMISACTPNLQRTSETLGKTIQERLDQVAGYLEELYSVTHPTGKCAECSNGPKPCDKPTRQNIDWGEAKASMDMDGLLELTNILSGSVIANEVYQRFIEDDTFRRVNKLLDLRALRSISPEHGGSKPGLSLAVVATPNPPPNLEPLLEGQVKCERGASAPVRVGSTPGQEWGLILK